MFFMSVLCDTPLVYQLIVTLPSFCQWLECLAKRHGYYKECQIIAVS